MINSKAESQALAGLMTAPSFAPVGTHNPKLVFTGITRTDEYHGFATIDGESLDQAGFAEWAPGQPDHPAEHCGAFSNDGKLNNVVCNDYNYAYACELPLIGEGVFNILSNSLITT